MILLKAIIPAGRRSSAMGNRSGRSRGEGRRFDIGGELGLIPVKGHIVKHTEHATNFKAIIPAGRRSSATGTDPAALGGDSIPEGSSD